MNWTLAYALFALVPWMLWLLPRWLNGRRFGRCVLSACAHVLTLGWLSHSPSTAEDPLIHALIVISLIALVVLGGFLQHLANGWYARQRDPLWED